MKKIDIYKAQNNLYNSEVSGVLNNSINNITKKANALLFAIKNTIHENVVIFKRDLNINIKPSYLIVYKNN